MPANYYFDDPEEGLARETSHPHFLALAEEDFYYDCSDDFSPFGNDDGSDTLASLEEMYQDGGTNDDGPGFVADLIAGWDFGVPENLMEADGAVTAAWVAQNHMNAHYLDAICNAHIATAFGQLKITGKINPV